MTNVLMVYQSTEGQARRIVEFMAGVARELGHAVELAEVERWTAASMEAPPGAVLLIASVHVGRHSAEASKFVHEHRDLLGRIPTAFVSVSLSAGREERVGEAEKYVEDFLRETGWRPMLTATVAGALRYTQYNFIKRSMMKQIAARGGLPTDTSRDHEFTDWDEVRRLCERFLELAAAGVESELAPAGP